MHVSVVIPTFNRCSTLLDCLEALGQQTYDADCFEVIVVDDGSDDETAQRIGELALSERWLNRLTYEYQPNQGPATARNRGIRAATGHIVLFLGDDIIACPELLQCHVTSHQNAAAHDVAVLGRVDWSPHVVVTPLMRWMMASGDQFAFDSLQHTEPTFWHFYTSNISLKREILLHHGGFDEEFPYAAYEDVELGLRLMQAGLRIVYQPAALAYHDHAITFESHLNRAAKVGASAYIMDRKHPNLIHRPGRSWRSPVKQVLLACSPVVTVVGSDRLKLLAHRLQYEQRYWQAFDRQAATGARHSAVK